jgi:hypothetical protein
MIVTMSKNALRKWRRYGKGDVVPMADLEAAWNHIDRRNYRMEQYTAIAPKIRRVRKSDGWRYTLNGINPYIREKCQAAIVEVSADLREKYIKRRWALRHIAQAAVKRSKAA